MDDRQAFKIGFLKAAAEQGYGLEQTLELVKTAEKLCEANWLTTAASGIGNFVGSGLGSVAKQPFSWAKDIAEKGVGTLAGMAPVAMVGAPILGGAGLGYLAAKANDLNDEDPDELKMQELVSEYTRATNQARLAAAVRKLQNSRTGGRPIL